MDLCLENVGKINNIDNDASEDFVESAIFFMNPEIERVDSIIKRRT